MDKEIQLFLESLREVDEDEKSKLLKHFMASILENAAINIAKSLSVVKTEESELAGIFQTLTQVTESNHIIIKQAMSALEETGQMQKDSHSLADTSFIYPTFEVFGSMTYIQDARAALKNITKMTDRSYKKEWDKPVQSKLKMLLQQYDNSIKLIKLYNQLIAQVQKTIDKLYSGYQSQFIEESESLFGRSPTFNVHFTHNNNRLLTNLYNNILDTLENDVRPENLLDLIRIFASDEYAAIVNNQYMTTLQEANYKNIHSILLPITAVLSQMQDMDRSQYTIQVQDMVENIVSDDSKECIEKFLRQSQLNHHLAELLTKGQYIPAKILKILPKDQVGTVELVKKKRMIFQEFDVLAKFVQDHKNELQVGEEKIIIRYVLKDSGFVGKDSITEYFKLIEKISKQLDEYSSLHTRRTQGKSTDTAKGDDVDNYSFVVDNYGLIKDLEPQPLTKPGEVIGASIQEIKNKLFSLLQHDPFLCSLEDSYNGSEKQLLHNYIILGPFGGGKTALLRELAYNKDFVTIACSYADISSMYFGAAEKNIKNMFEQAYKKHQETGKQVLMLVDEFDMFFNMQNAIGSNNKSTIQKQLQIVMDGVIAYPGVHLIGLSNVPQGIPMDIYRRAKTFVIQALVDKEIGELIKSRLGRYKLDPEMHKFFSYLNAEAPEDESIYHSIIKDLKNASPKIIATICKQAADVYFQKIKNSVKDGKIIASLTKKLKTLNRNRATDEKYQKLFTNTGVFLTFKDFISVTQKEFDNPVIKSEVEVYKSFYETIEQHIGQIKGSFQK